MTSNCAICHRVWVHVPKHEEDEELSSLSSFTLAKNNMMMVSNCTIRHRLWVHVPKDEEDEELSSSSSFTPAKKKQDDDKELHYSLSSFNAWSRS
jgi:hypothetical protein